MFLNKYMGCIFSQCKNRNEYGEKLLTKNKYCFQCGKTYSHKEYDKHIKKCTKVYENRFNR
tara:strand:+ start:1553 stop:1735 length:183 start_codon:yes stop_codon:yes gene_type:complete